MALTASDKGGQEYDPVPAGIHQAICYGIVDLGTQDAGRYAPRRKVLFIWELPHERGTFERDGEQKDLPRAISQQYTLSLNEKANLRHALEAWRSRPFTEEELRGFDLKTVLGANCQLTVVHNYSPAKKKTYANVASVSPLGRGMEKLEAENPLLWFSMEEIDDLTKFKKPSNMPDWVFNLIGQSEEVQYAQEASSHVQRPPVQSDPDEDDVPF